MELQPTVRSCRFGYNKPIFTHHNYVNTKSSTHLSQQAEQTGGYTGNIGRCVAQRRNGIKSVTLRALNVTTSTTLRMHRKGISGEQLKFHPAITKGNPGARRGGMTSQEGELNHVVMRSVYAAKMEQNALRTAVLI